MLVFAFALAGGCPGRQLFLAGEGDADAGIFVLEMIVGAAVSHNFSLVDIQREWSQMELQEY